MEREADMKKLSIILWVMAVLLSDAMCAVVAYKYSGMVWAIRYAGYSAPADVAFLYAIPFVIAIAACLILAHRLRKRAK